MSEASATVRSAFTCRRMTSACARADSSAHELRVRLDSLVNPLNSVQEKLSRAREAGIEIEIDAFGTGHASIFSFQKILPNRVKIAREVLLDVEHSQETRQTLRAICQLAQSFSADTVAEGIESVQMADTVHLMGCDYMQGFGLSRPKGFEQLLFELSLASGSESETKTA